MSTISPWALFLITLCLYLPFADKAWGQQDAHYSQYMFNRFALNPAAAGHTEEISTNNFFRKQWAGLSGAPVTQSFSIHSPVRYKSMGIGLQLINDATGFQKSTGVYAAAAYKINLATGIFSFGLCAGLRNYRFNTSLLNPKDADDNVIPASSSRSLPDFCAGVYFQKTRYYAGLSINHLTRPSVNYTSRADMRLRRHVYFLAGYSFSYNRTISLLPSLLVKYVKGAGLQADLTCLVRYKEAIWGGLSIRTRDAISFQTGFAVNSLLKGASENINIGFAYDMSTSGMAHYNSGTFEVMLKYGFTLLRSTNNIYRKKPVVNPLFF